MKIKTKKNKKNIIGFGDFSVKFYYLSFPFVFMVKMVEKKLIGKIKMRNFFSLIQSDSK